MKTYKLDHRYNAQKKWGFTYSVEFSDREWQAFYAMKAVAEQLFGTSTETVWTYTWRRDAEILRSAPWAYHYRRTNKPTFVYFRTEDEMSQALMMYALTARV
jgi:hypothetical protein